MTSTPPKPLTLADVRPNEVYTLAEMAAVVKRCEKTLASHGVALLPRHSKRDTRLVLGSTILAYLGNPGLVRPTETARQRSKRADATMKAATAVL